MLDREEIRGRDFPSRNPNVRLIAARRERRRAYALVVIASVLAVATLTACDDGMDGDPGTREPPRPARPHLLRGLGAAEGRLDLVARPGYVEDGTTDPAVDWVTGFEGRTGCDVNVTLATSAEETLELLRTGGYDGALAAGDAALQLVAAKEVSPVNVTLVRNYADVFDGLKNERFNTDRGRVYGIPHSRFAHVLVWRTDKLWRAPTSWDVVFDETSPYEGKVAVYDSPMSIADAAVYLMHHRPDLRITDPYALDELQFAAVVAVLEAQRTIVAKYWSDTTRAETDFARGESVVGAAPQSLANHLAADRLPVRATLPVEGGTGRADVWMVSSRARHPSCMYRWLDHVLSPRANAEAAKWLGQAPANTRACRPGLAARHCRLLRAADERYFGRIHYWRTPRRDCGDARGRVCKDYADWVEAWDEIKG